METLKTRKIITNDEKISFRIREFFRKLAIWGGHETKKNLGKALDLHPTVFFQYEKNLKKIASSTVSKIMELHPDLPKDLYDELMELSKMDHVFPHTSTGYKVTPVQYEVNERVVDFSDETVEIEYITSKVNAGNGYVEMNHPVVMKVNKSYIKKNLPEDVFAVTSHGDSMLRRGITDDTLLIVKRCAQIDECIGQIVVCICDAEFIVKKLVKNQKGDLELHSESFREIPPIELKHRQFRIFGYVITSINDY